MIVCTEKYNDDELRAILRKKLDPSRYEHSLGVAYTACSLFLAHGHGSTEELSRAYTAGLLHDCAKCLDEEKSEKYIKKYNVELSEMEKAHPFLIHAKLGAVLAKEKYGITDEEIISSIRWHTTGCSDMSFTEAVIFSADFIEPNRRQLPCYEEIRPLIYRDLDKAVYLILKHTIEHLKSKGQPIEEHTLQAFEYYKSR
ncbi:MAG: bis(5'-nucleosyl)-tetraphosphatase (symmetrical) YqeK [Lachnospiraceae bacterium]|nr:bis(5'-nucleosyl)-tetraphosphatase (symmetrical) YqeK [Lachnospiraceae bacterium]